MVSGKKKKKNEAARTPRKYAVPYLYFYCPS